MSNRNRDGKQSAREALREQRAREAARAKRKRTAVVAGAVVGVLAVGTGIGLAVANSGSSGGSSSASGSVVPPKGAIGKNSLVIPVGAANAPSTLTIYEDFRCPACDAFEKAFTPTIHQLEDTGQIRTEYHLVTLIDGNLGGTGSLNAANAAACAQDAGRFRAYHDVIYNNQPDERDDKFADKNTLLQLADKVPGLKTPAFTSCVTNGTHDSWVKKSNDDFNASGFNSTPTVLLNGKSIYGGSNNLTPASLTQMVQAANKGKPAGTVTATPPS
ncbi:DsbA family protein [Actinacidiphila acidipaludis]|uniref:DsbA family protein n=1 Tax=Actinacidiphila acidipaludis TaxID=2873382 RepID=A0ABS7Q0G5_9ACTN|nr:thioredoxin domain-containing protein [Streptomyces acidipaludis]MBY8876626.1 DsbA family protein [Streptomyces acidipaludis]